MPQSSLVTLLASGQTTPTGASNLCVAQGSVSGTGSAITVSGLGFTPRVVIVKGNLNQVAYIATDAMPAGDAVEFDGQDASGVLTQIVTSMSSGQFIIGTNADVNVSATNIYWLALGDASSTQLFTGSYSGTGAVRSITGLTNPPVLVSTHTASVADGAAFQSSGLPPNDSLAYHNTPTTSANRITALGATSFTLGTNATTNTSSATYYYWAVSASPLLKMFTYTGNGGASFAYTGLGIAPNIVILRDTSAANNTGVFVTTSMISASVQGLYVSGHNSAFDNTMFTSLDSNGFTTGASVATNTNGDVQYGYAFKDGFPSVATATSSNLMTMGMG